MAPQIPDSVAALPDSVESEIKSSAELVAQDAEKRDAFQRSQTNRKRGWHDYQLLVNGNMKTFLVESLCVFTSRTYYEDDDALSGWNIFNANGTDNVVNFLTDPPPSYGRVPNYIATDRAVQATDGAIIIVQPSPWIKSVDYMLRTFEYIRNSYEGKNAWSYEDDYESSPTEKELAALNARTKRPLAVVIFNGEEGLEEDPERSSFEENLKLLREACAKFMEEYGNANEVRLFEVANYKTELHEIVSLMLSDLEEGRGIEFSPPSVRPWDIEADKMFDTLDVVKKEVKKDENEPVGTNNLGVWSQLTEFLTGQV